LLSFGGPARLSAYGTNELFGDQYYYFRAGYLHELFSLPPFVGRNVYVIGAYEFGKMYNPPPRKNCGMPTWVEPNVVPPLPTIKMEAGFVIGTKYSTCTSMTENGPVAPGPVSYYRNDASAL
jgi:NTE family protein